MIEETQRLLTDHEAAEVCGLSVQTLRNWRSQNHGPSFLRLGARAVRYRMADLNEFLEACRVSPGAVKKTEKKERRRKPAPRLGPMGTGEHGQAAP